MIYLKRRASETMNLTQELISNIMALNNKDFDFEAYQGLFLDYLSVSIACPTPIHWSSLNESLKCF